MHPQSAKVKKRNKGQCFGPCEWSGSRFLDGFGWNALAFIVGFYGFAYGFEDVTRMPLCMRGVVEG